MHVSPNWPIRRLFAFGVPVLLVLAAVVTWLLWPNPRTAPPRARQYLDFTACLLTGPQGVQDPQATPVWAGMQQASLATHAKIQYIAVTGAQTSQNATAYLASLAQSHCRIVFTSGEAPAAAATQQAGAYPSVTFYVLGGTTDRGNLKTITNATAEQTQHTVEIILRNAVAADPTNASTPIR
jgi:hypothetical protein